MKHSISRGALLSAALAWMTLGMGAVASPGSRPPTPAESFAPSDHLSYGRFKDLSIYSPAGQPKSFVLLLSGAAGWDSRVAALARQLADRGALVAGIDLPKLDANLKADLGDCVSWTEIWRT